jgi:hypothetical protein
VKLALAFLFLLLIGCATTPPTRQVEKLKPLPVALDADFSLRKTKQYFLDPLGRGLVGGAIDPSIAFEKVYHLYGAITALDAHQRFGNYYTFFWHARRRADVTVLLEYRQDKLHSLVQAREVRYHAVRGSRETKFAIIGDDFFDDGRVIAWRVSLVVDGRVVATKRSYLWE